MSNAPSAFSSGNPKLQKAWDSTSLRALMTCPRYYQYSILEGWGGSNTDLEFGILFASSVEVWKKAILNGKTTEEAELEAVGYALLNSGKYTDSKWTPWGGQYRTQWRCTGTEPYKNAKGNKAKCPYSHKGVWIDGFAPTTCGECGSATDTKENWVSNDPNKDRYTLVRLVCWYCEENLTDNGGIKPYAFPDGSPAVELSFRLPLPRSSPYNENYILCGHLDSIMDFSGEKFIADNKTTKKTLSKAWKEQFSPNIQVEVYDLAGSILFPDLNLKGVLLEGAQTLQSGARYGLHLVRRNDNQREETLNEILWWIAYAEKLAEDGYWPRNQASCYNCAFKVICRMDPASRDTYLSSSFTKREPWNPLQER